MVDRHPSKSIANLGSASVDYVFNLHVIPLKCNIYIPVMFIHIW